MSPLACNIKVLSHVTWNTEFCLIPCWDISIVADGCNINQHKPTVPHDKSKATKC